MPIAVWTGTLSFGLVSVPVRLVPATEPKDVRFHLYDRAGRRVRYERVAEPADGTLEPGPEPASAPPRERPPTDPSPEEHRPERSPASPSGRETVAWQDLMFGWENDLGDVVTLSRAEIDRARPERSRSIDIEDFVDLAEIDPVSFDKTYYAVPRSVEAATPYVLLHRAMREAGRIGIGRFVLRTKPHLVAVRPMREVLAVETLFFGDEVRDPAGMVPGLGVVEVDERELELAIKLIEVLRTEWDPAAYADTYREELLRILSEKAPAVPTEPTTAPARPGPGGSAVEQLMAALKESVETARMKRPRRGSRSERAV